MPSREMSDSASNSNGRNGSELLPDLEDLGKVLKTCSPGRGRKPNQSQTPNGKDCGSCPRKDTCGTAVQASIELVEQGDSVSGEQTQHGKDREKISTARVLMRQQPKVREQTSK